MRRLALAPILVCALLTPSTALALGVGDIELQSALNQPLDAEIPLRGVSAEESGDIVVTLASEQAFREVGLERPFSLTKLQFEVTSRNGSHYIQVSSHEPITEPFLSFLVEVDSPEGNLLREYTVLLDPPVFASEKDASATDEGSEQRPTRDDADEPSGASGTVAGGGDDMSGRLADTDTAGGSAVSRDTDAPATSAGQQRSGRFGDTPMFLRIAREEEAAERKLAEQAAQREREAAAAARERARAESVPVPSGSTVSGGTGTGQATRAEPRRQQEYGPVKEGETLWGIAERLQRGEVTTQQMMLALLRYNPEAFESSNVNRLKQGYVLRVPDADEVRSISAQQAIAQVRDQNGLWQKWRDSLQQGDATRVAAAQRPQGTEDAGAAADNARGDAGASDAAGSADHSRLDIVGADEGGATSDESVSATSSNASGAREQLQLAREELASVRSEKQELSERVEQLESTVDKMEQLVTVREQQLAQLERQLADLREQTGQSGDTATATAGAGDGAQGEQAEAATGAGEAAQGEDEEMMVADATDGSGGGGGATASGDSGDSGGGDVAGDPAAGEGTTGDQAGASEQSAADDGGAETQTAASDQQREVVNPADDPQQQERGWLDAALGFLASIGATISGVVSGLAGGSALSLPVIGGAGVAVLALVLLAVRQRRAAQAAADDELMAPIAVGEGHAETEPMGLGGDDLPATESPVATADSPSESSARASLMDEELDLSGLDVDPEGTTPGDEAEQDDTLVEADTYLAYGLHQQAEDLLRLALEEHPDRLDYREKLLETLSAAGKGDEFVSAAEEFHDRLGGSSDPAWQRVSAMGRKIAPDHALFAAGAAAAAGATMAASDSGTDDDFAFDLGSESPASSGDEFPGAAEADLDLGDAPVATASGDSGGSDDLTFDLSDLEDSTPATEPATETSESPATSAGADDGGLDFDLGDLGFGDDSPSTTVSAGDEPSTGAASAPDNDGLDLDLGDLGIDDSATAAGPDSGTASAQGEGEIDLSDFEDLDLGSDSSSPATETAAAATGEGDLSFDLDESTSSDSPGLDDFGLGDLGSGTTDTTSGIEDLETGASESTTAFGDQEDPFGGLDDLGGDAESGEFDLSSLEQELDEPDPPQPASAAAADGGAAPAGGTDDLATMLDLAKAYIDMGDADSASNALEEVIAGGTEEQRAEARSLLETVQ